MSDYLGSIVDGPWLAIADPESTNSSGLEYWPRLLNEGNVVFGLQYDHHITGRYIVNNLKFINYDNSDPICLLIITASIYYINRWIVI